jgi:REP element-mobilizing transposase RayT
MEKFQGKYRIPSARAAFWDYSWIGAYFVTLCTKNRYHYFGKIVEGNMLLSPLGTIADVLWHEIKHHAKHVELGAFVVMPNHVHGIVRILPDEQSPSAVVETTHALSLLSLPSSSSLAQQRFQNQGKNSLSSIIGSYKSAVSKHAHRLGFDFTWQARFHDHIIRNEEAYQRIATYITNNPKQWEEDTFYSA